MFKRRSTKPDDDVKSAAGQSPAGGVRPQPQGTHTASPKPADTGLGVPPFRPAPLKDKDTTDMARPPFAPTPSSSVPTMPPAPNRTSAAMQPARTPGAAESSERRTLVVGRGISVQGTITDAERLVVEGTVEASMIHAAELSVIQGGVFKGEVEVEEAEIAGTIDGVVTARTSLVVRATGRVLGRARCRRLQVEDGGQITGQIEMLTDSAAPSATATPASAAPPVTPTAVTSDLDRPAAPAEA